MSQHVLDSSLHDWRTHVEGVFESASNQSVVLTDLLARAERFGISRGIARREIFSICARPEAQAVWSDWGDVRDREELRLRLECLRRAEDLHPSVYEFLIFFFRASDPVLYQAAALALGIHLDRHDRLEDYFTSFAERRNIPLDRPVELDGERSRRRVLLGLTGRAIAAERLKAAPSSIPLQLDDPDRYLSQDSADLSVCLVALQALVSAARESSELTAFSRHIISEIPHHSEVSVSRILIRNWGRVLVGLRSVSDQWRVDVWSSFLSRLFASYSKCDSSAGIGPLVQLLHKMDEVIRTGAYFSPELQRRLLRELDLRFQPDEQVFAAVRLNVWCEREAEGSTGTAIEDLSKAGGEVGEILGRVVAVESRGLSTTDRSLAEGSVESRRRGLFAEWLTLVNEPRAWVARPLEARALMAFFLLDYSLYLKTDLQEIDRLLNTHRDGNPAGSSDSARPPGGSIPGRMGLATLRLLTQLLQVEPSGAGLLVDPSWIYQISDPMLLLKLLPAGRRSERLGPLADAFEHQLRFHMASDEDFSPEHFLYLITVRKPHPAFYDQLIRTCQDRIYQTEVGRVVPVKEILQTLAREAQAAAGGSLDRSTPVDEPSTITGDEPLPGESVFGNELARLRRSLIALADQEDPFKGLVQLTDILNPKTTDSRSGSKGLTDFVGRVNGQKYNVVQDGLAEWVGQSYDRFAAVMQEHAVRLEEEIPDLIPNALSEIGGARDAALSIRRRLADVTETARRVSGCVEAALVDRAISGVRNRVAEWAASLERLHDTWILRREPSLDDPAARWTEVAEEISTLGSREVRHRALELFYRSLLHFGSEGLEEGVGEGRTLRGERDEWSREYAVLQWSTELLRDGQLLAPEDRRLWIELAVDSWNDLAEEAMAEGYESRVVRLVDDARYAPLLEHDASTAVLDTARSWLFDRYHLRPVRSIERMVDQTGRSVASLQTGGSFLVHFSHVWLALLVGAMLLLDFGDAWTAMAAEGDVSGIVLTSLLGVGGTFLYLLTDLVKKTRRAPEDNIWRHRFSRLVRAALFLILCLAVALGLTTLLWFLLSGTEVVVHGEYAVYHVIVWTGFALFVGVFFGLLANAT